ncbi:hypothetical protein A6R68_19014 [Neotoma lepida]|uniref:Ras-related protein Rab-4 n=1 Tax=Neotoma lepida TaxID=56216 RepID=A0A1A6HJ44_NEOLE|nr:hypothetical protein A6R68_19014 [Neotoma lepida]
MLGLDCDPENLVVSEASFLDELPVFPSTLHSSAHSNFLFKFLVIGNAGTGKSCLLHQFIEKKCESVTRSYYRGAAGALLVYDITSRETYNALTNWLTDARMLASQNIVIILCGNKKDLDADQLMFLETSALTGENVEEAFMQCARKILNKIESGELDPERMGSGIQYGDAALRQLRSPRRTQAPSSVVVSGAQLLEPEEAEVFTTSFSTLHRNTSSWGKQQCTLADRAQQPYCKPTQRTVPLDATRMQRSLTPIYPFMFRYIRLVLHTARHLPTAEPATELINHNDIQEKTPGWSPSPPESTPSS